VEKEVTDTIEKLNGMQVESSQIPIDIKSWQTVPAINGRVATNADLETGLAIYCVGDGCPDHYTYQMALPKLSYLVDEETKQEQIVIVTQVESTPQGVLAGYKSLDGGIGVCLLDELRFLEEQEINSLAGIS
jgi:hypothetical protein